MKIHLSLPVNALRRGLLLLLLSGLLPAPRGLAANSSPPQYMTYQGYLTDANGNALGNTNTGPKNYDVVFRIWDVQTGGNIGTSDELYAEQQTVTVDRGYFSVLLGEGSAYQSEPHPLTLASLFTNNTASDRFVEFTVQGIGVNNANVTIAPRLRLLTSPYSFLAANAVNAVYAASAGQLINNANNPVVSVLGGAVGINKPSPASALDVNGTVTATGLNVNGSAGVSALSVSGAAAANTLQAANGLNVLAGNVGIGTSSPQAPLDVESTGFPSTLIRSSSSYGTWFDLANTSAGGGFWDVISSGSGDQQGAGKLLFCSGTGPAATANGSILVLQPNGNVGIGTSTPAASLEVNGNAQVDGTGLFSGTVGIGQVTTGFYGDGGNIALRTYPGGAIFFQTTSGNATRMFISSTGNVGIGTTTPDYPLDVESANTTNYSVYGYLNVVGLVGVSQALTTKEPVSIYGAGRILTGGEFDALSDARVKEIVRRSDTRSDLATVRQLQITDYRKLDRVQYGGRLEKGVIAQEVEAVIPEAVSTSTNFIPDIYSLPEAFNYRNGTLWVTLAKPHGLVVGDQVRLITEAGTLNVPVAAVQSPLVFGVGQVQQAPRQLFVYGKQVRDLRAVNYDRLFTTGLGALQELANHMDQMEEKAARVDVLEQEVADLKKLVTQLAEATKNSKLTAAAAGPAPLPTTASLDR